MNRALLSLLLRQYAERLHVEASICLKAIAGGVSDEDAESLRTLARAHDLAAEVYERVLGKLAS